MGTSDHFAAVRRRRRRIAGARFARSSVAPVGNVVEGASPGVGDHRLGDLPAIGGRHLRVVGDVVDGVDGDATDVRRVDGGADPTSDRDLGRRGPNRGAAGTEDGNSTAADGVAVVQHDGWQPIRRWRSRRGAWRTRQRRTRTARSTPGRRPIAAVHPPQERSTTRR